MTQNLKDKVMEQDLLLDFGRHIRSLRLSQKISQEELALKTGLDRTYISGIERGLRNLSLINIFRLADGLNTPPSELLKFGDNIHE